MHLNPEFNIFITIFACQKLPAKHSTLVTLSFCKCSLTRNVCFWGALLIGIMYSICFRLNLPQNKIRFVNIVLLGPVVNEHKYVQMCSRDFQCSVFGGQKAQAKRISSSFIFVVVVVFC